MLPPLPAPPAELLDAIPPAFAVADGLATWVRENLLDEDGPIWNEHHAHLLFADVGYLWATGEATSGGMLVLGQAEIFAPKGRGFVKTRQEHLIRSWFGRVPDFIVTLSAGFVAGALAEGDPVAPLALLEHELYHCAQAVDEFGDPRFRKAGSRKGEPVFTMKGHDVEVHLGEVDRYGAHSEALRELVRLANRGPSVARASLEGVCGTCMRRVA